MRKLMYFEGSDVILGAVCVRAAMFGRGTDLICWFSCAFPDGGGYISTELGRRRRP